MKVLNLLKVRAWSIRKGTLAPKAAGVIHTDFEKGFICAEVMQFKDLEEADGDEAKVRAAGKLMQKVRIQSHVLCILRSLRGEIMNSKTEWL